MKKKHKLSLFELSLFSYHLSVLLNSGINLIDSLMIIKSQKNSKILTRMIDGIENDIMRGCDFSQALRISIVHIPDFYLTMIGVGEKSGDLKGVLKELSNYYSSINKLKTEVKTVMVYPSILVAMVFLLTIFMLAFAVPFFKSILLDKGELPVLTKTIFEISDFLNIYWWLIILTFIVLIITYKLLLKLNKFKYFIDKLKTNFIITKKLIINVSTAKISRSMGLLIKGGVEILEVMRIVNPLFENKYLEEKFAMCIIRIGNGESITKSLKSVEIFPEIFLNMLKIGEKGSDIAVMLIESANFFDELVYKKLKSLTNLISPISIIIIGMFICMIVLALIIPMTSAMIII